MARDTMGMSSSERVELCFQETMLSMGCRPRTGCGLDMSAPRSPEFQRRYSAIQARRDGLPSQHKPESISMWGSVARDGDFLWGDMDTSVKYKRPALLCSSPCSPKMLPTQRFSSTRLSESSPVPYQRTEDGALCDAATKTARGSLFRGAMDAADREVRISDSPAHRARLEQPHMERPRHRESFDAGSDRDGRPARSGVISHQPDTGSAQGCSSVYCPDDVSAQHRQSDKERKAAFIDRIFDEILASIGEKPLTSGGALENCRPDVSHRLSRPFPSDVAYCTKKSATSTASQSDTPLQDRSCDGEGSSSAQSHRCTSVCGRSCDSQMWAVLVHLGRNNLQHISPINSIPSLGCHSVCIAHHSLPGSSQYAMTPLWIIFRQLTTTLVMQAVVLGSCTGKTRDTCLERDHRVSTVHQGCRSQVHCNFIHRSLTQMRCATPASLSLHPRLTSPGT